MTSTKRHYQLPFRDMVIAKCLMSEFYIRATIQHLQLSKGADGGVTLRYGAGG